MKETVKLIGFILVALGTLGLIINEFVFDWWGWQHATKLFAAASVLGFISLAFAHWGMKQVD